MSTLRLTYFLHFVYLATMVAFMPIYLSELGLSESQIGMIFSLMSAARIFSALTLSYIADRFQNRKTVLRFAAGGTLAALAGLLVLRTHPWLMINFFFIGAFIGPIIPMLDTTAIDHLGERYTAFGRIRLYGTLSFGFSSLGIGYLVHAFGGRVVPMILVLAYAAMNFAVLGVPDSQMKTSNPLRLAELRRAMRRPLVLLLLITGFVYNFAFCSYNIFFSLHLRELSISSPRIGTAWLLSTLAEALFFHFAPGISRRLPPQQLLLISYFLTGLRWLAMSVTESYPLILALQLVHAFSFAGFYVAIVNFVRENFPAHMRTIAQTVMLMVNFGLAIILGSMASGWFYQHFGGALLFRWAGWLTLAVAVLFGASLLAQRNAESSA